MSVHIKSRQAYKEIIFTTGKDFIYLFHHFMPAPARNRVSTNVFKENLYTFRDNYSLKIFLSSSEIWSALKRKNLLPERVKRKYIFDHASWVLTFILLHCTWYKSRLAALERVPVHHHSADYVSFPLESLGPL